MRRPSTASSPQRQHPSYARTHVSFCGTGGSPYTQKMLAVLRFYRQPHRYVTGPAREGLMQSGIERPRPQLAPTFYFQDQPMVDSTPIIARLEEEFATQQSRSLVPPDEAMAFLSRLIEDYGDEWVTKMMCVIQLLQFAPVFGSISDTSISSSRGVGTTSGGTSIAIRRKQACS